MCLLEVASGRFIKSPARPDRANIGRTGPWPVHSLGDLKLMKPVRKFSHLFASICIYFTKKYIICFTYSVNNCALKLKGLYSEDYFSKMNPF